MDFVGIGLVLILLGSVMAALPASPFRMLINLIDVANPVFQSLCWFFPIDAMMALLQAWLSIIAVYYTIVIVARWIKLVS